MTLSDSHWKLFGLFTRAYEIYEKVSEYKYYEKISPEQKTEDKIYYSIFLRSDVIANAYSRSTHSLLTYIGITYSVFYLIFGVMSLIVSGIIHKLYAGALLEKTYQV